MTPSDDVLIILGVSYKYSLVVDENLGSGASLLGWNPSLATHQPRDPRQVNFFLPWFPRIVVSGD